MKAVQLLHYGGKGGVVVSDIPQLHVTDGAVLIDVHFAGVNPIDWKVQAGYLKDVMPLTLPITLGGDFSGIILETGSGVTQFAKGDAVYGQASVLAGNSGSFAEMLITTPDFIALKPKHLDFLESGALPLVGVSALQAITEHIKLLKGERILIHGGAGGIGSIAIQIAHHLGAYVATTVSANDMEYVTNLGADEVIDYKTQKFEDVLHDYHAVFDTVGGETTERSVGILTRGGRLVSMVQAVDTALAKRQGIIAMVQQSKVTTERLNHLTELIESGVISIHIEKIFFLDNAADALDYLQRTPPKGKVVIKVK